MSREQVVEASVQVPWEGTDAEFLEVLTKIIFSTGFSRAVVQRRWSAFVQAFARFCLEDVAAMDEVRMEALCSQSSGIVRNHRKVQATVCNASVCLNLRRDYGTLATFAKEIASQDEVQGSMRLRQRFHQVGESAALTLYRSLSGLDPSWAPSSADSVEPL
ncbi:MAG: DNA-3-methyladenine glycosylase I [Firmicutes bacterium]|nr:DNA-3-methyladenine glycosylase I [Bacillota bacterium]